MASKLAISAAPGNDKGGQAQDKACSSLTATLHLCFCQLCSPDACVARCKVRALEQHPVMKPFARFETHKTGMPA